MKKILAIVGSFALFASTSTTVVACVDNTVSNEQTDNEKYDNTPEIQEITRNAVDRMKSVVLADQFQLSDDLNWAGIVDYDKTNNYTTLFDEDSVKTSEKFRVNLDGTGGEPNILAKQLVGLIINGIGNLPIPGLDGLINGLNLDDYIDQFGDIVTLLPKTITSMPLQQLVTLVPTVIKFLGGLVMGLIGDPAGNTLNLLAEVISTALESALKNYGVNDLIKTLIDATDVEIYKDLSFHDLSRRMWMSLLTTIGYGVNSSYVSNPTNEIDYITNPTDGKVSSNSKRVAAKIGSILKPVKEGETKEPIKPIEGEEREFLGVLKYAISTVKMLEIYLQFFGEDFFTLIPDVKDWTPDKGNEHLFSKTKTNREYFHSLREAKVSTLTQVKSGINLSFVWKVLKTFVGTPADKESGPMFQKLLNALLTDYQITGQEQRLFFPVWTDILENILDFFIDSSNIARFAKDYIGSVLWQLKGILTNEVIPESVIAAIENIENIANSPIINLDLGDILKYITEFRKFLSDTTEAKLFMNKAFDYLWTGEISIILPSLLSKMGTKLKLDTFNLQSLIYDAKILDIFNLLNVDINKYGSSYTELSISELITRLDTYIDIDKISYQDLNKENLDLKLIPKILDILVKENPIKLTAEDDDGKEATDHSFIRQLISNLKNPNDTKIIQKILGIEVVESENQDKPNVEVIQNSLIGLIIKFLFPTLIPSSTVEEPNDKDANEDKTNEDAEGNVTEKDDTENAIDTYTSEVIQDETKENTTTEESVEVLNGKYTNEDLINVSGFNRNFLMAVGDLLTALFEGKDYTYLIQPLVMDDKVWKLLDVRNIYFENSGGKLLYQKFVLEFDPEGVVLSDGSVIGDKNKGVYEVIFRRTAPDEKFFFQQIIKRIVVKG